MQECLFFWSIFAIYFIWMLIQHLVENVKIGARPNFKMQKFGVFLMSIKIIFILEKLVTCLLLNELIIKLNKILNLINLNK